MFKPRRQNNLKVTLVSFIALVGLCSCAPEMKAKLFPEPITDFGPRNLDPELKINHLLIARIAATQLSFDKDMKSAELFNAAENILLLSKRSHPEFEKLGHILIEGFYNSNATTTRSLFSKSPYLLAALGETQADAKDAIFNVVKMLDDQGALVLKVVEQSKTEYIWPGAELKLDQVVASIEVYIGALQIKWKAAKLDVRVYKGLIDGINEEFQPMASKFRTLLLSMSGEKNLVSFIGKLHQLMTMLAVELDKETTTLLQKGVTLGALVDSAKDESDGLRVIVAVWRLLDEEERKNQFNAMSPALYKFLNSASDGQFDCLENKSCGLDIYTILAKKMQILPQIKTYGIEKLKNQVNEGAIQYATTLLLQRAIPLLKVELPKILEEKIIQAFKAEAQVLAGISKDLKGFLSPGVDKWAKSFLLEKSIGLNALELSDVHVNFASSTKLSFGKLKSQTVGAATLGSSMSALGVRWQFQQEQFTRIPFESRTNTIIKLLSSKQEPEHIHMRELLSQINKGLAIGGFRISETERFKSLSFAADPDGKANVNLDLKSFFDNPITFVVPNTMSVSDSFHASPIDKNKISADVEEQAQLLKGLSRMLYFFRDWEPNSFDRLLGNVKINDFLSDPRMKNIDQKFFPKDILFTLFLGDAAVLLGNFIKRLSGILLLDEKRNMRWENETVAGDANAPVAAMAALVDISNGKRGEIASSGALASELLALVEFYNATEGVAKTNSTLLAQKMKDGTSTIDALMDGRKRIFLLISALANFLTHEMQASDGGIYHSYDMTRRAPIKGPRLLKDQVTVLTALTRAGSMNSAQVYKNAALDIYYFMNRKLWSEEKSFYQIVEGESSVGHLPEVVEALNAVENLIEIMPHSSLSQWKKISQPWYTALKQF